MRRVFPRRVFNLSFLRHPIIQLLCATSLVGTAIAGPDGGAVVGGDGSITQSGTTTINQSTRNMAIDWQSYDVNSNDTSSQIAHRFHLIECSAVGLLKYTVV